MISKIVKIAIYALSGGLLLAYLTFMFVYKWSPRAQNAWQNVENSSQVKVGMTKTEMLRIMGTPGDISPAQYREKEFGVEIYYYDPPFMASGGIEIYIGKDSTVTKVLPYEST